MRDQAAEKGMYHDSNTAAINKSNAEYNTNSTDDLKYPSNVGWNTTTESFGDIDGARESWSVY
jgi:hypothetical protein